jgi:hypothetical protein
MTLRRSRIAPVSRKQAARTRAYNQVREAVYERAQGRCEVNATWSCSRNCEQVHHKQGRLGDRMTDMDKMVAICYNCHEFIGKNPALAYERGWMLRRNVNENGDGV